MQTQDFIVVRHNPAYIHSPLASSLSLRFTNSRFLNQAFKQYNWIMVPIHLLGLLAPNTFYTSQEIPTLEQPLK